ncbi:MAG: immune inhibitor A [Chloroflexi bacterium]|nr:immune inhibitor A [Chloroflexota bacterium]MDK1044840.1 immune inhibitor A [Anaerolineales bacterium]MCI0806064.1 immune inhibitor A [Chloroflexota bacterium]MCI0826994.1 immune inhibitor A [Chloroflexota bacterium]MCI0853916.1 immune inhibitor A [Chloroflexota bacterium]
MEILRTRRFSIPLAVFATIVAASCATASTPSPTLAPSPTPAAAAFAPTPTGPAIPSPAIEAIEVDAETLSLLESVEVPSANPIDLARRLKGLTQDIPETLDPPAAPLYPGAREIFHAGNQDTNEQFEVQATLEYVTDHAYFWIQDGVAFDANDLERLAETFENRIYPTTREFFGSEWTPGIDGDPHIYLLYAGGLGFGIAGYFSSVDSLHPLVREDSNAHEMFYLNADNLDLGEAFTYQVLAHEFQHMIHWNLDRDETSWINEGLSELAVHVNGLGTARNHPLYTDNPDRSLNDWDPDDTGPNYGAASLFMVYFLDRFGKELTQDLVAHPANGLTSIDRVFEEAGLTDPISGDPIGADEAILDWVIANYLNDGDVADGRYSYGAFPDLRQTRETEFLEDCPAGEKARQVNPYGVHYIRLICEGVRILKFDGAEQTTVLAVDPFSGEYSFWSNKGDSSNMRLTRAFDLTDVGGPVSLRFQTWYEIEEDWDYVFLLASRDGGATWDFLRTPSGTDSNPNGNSFGWGYTSNTPDSRWIEETVDLSEYAGQEILLRFEYLTDAAVNGEGMMIDDVSIPEIGYFTDFEMDDGGWEAEGWVRIQNVLPQSFKLAWISMEDETTVEYIPLGVNNTAQIPIDIGEGGAGVLVIVPTTRFTRQPASYSFSFSEPQ